MSRTYFYLYIRGEHCCKCRQSVNDAPCFARIRARAVIRDRGWFKKRKVEEIDYFHDEIVCGGCVIDTVLR